MILICDAMITNKNSRVSVFLSLSTIDTLFCILRIKKSNYVNFLRRKKVESVYSRAIFERMNFMTRWWSSTVTADCYFCLLRVGCFSVVRDLTSLVSSPRMCFSHFLRLSWLMLATWFLHLRQLSVNVFVFTGFIAFYQFLWDQILSIPFIIFWWTFRLFLTSWKSRRFCLR